jgi:uncharacterized delta-60 repeat protein
MHARALRDNVSLPKAEYGEERVMDNHLVKGITVGALLWVGITRAWAGLGDIDTHFGNEGRIEGWGIALAVLPDDRLVIGQGANDGFHVARFDANGKVDPTFGDGGASLIPLPARIRGTFAAFSVAHTPDGGLLFAGILQDAGPQEVLEAVLRLDRDGHLVTSFGGQGDGLYHVNSGHDYGEGWIPTTLMAMTVDASGRALVAERSWPALSFSCAAPTTITRLTPSGTPDSAFGTNGRARVPGVDLCGGAALFGARNDGSIVIGARGAIVGLDATGALDWTFGVGGYVSHGLPNDWGRGVLLPDGGVLILERDSITLTEAVLTKFDRSGRLDSTFGAGNGSVRIDLGPVFFGISGARYVVHDFLLMPDAVHVYLKLEVLHPDGTTACAGGIARVSFDGTPDLSFGRQGLACLDYGAFPFSVLASQRNGSPLLRLNGYQTGGVYRLLVDATASPGMLTMVRNGSHVEVGEAEGTITVPVVRTAGHDGAVSLSFSTGPRHWDDDLFLGGGDDPAQCNATPGSDFHAASGRLDWADGDVVEREITVTILDDEVEEPCERFRIGISNPQGGALTLESDGFPDYQASVDVWIIDDEAATLPTPTPPTSTPPRVPVSADGSGGGGSMSWATLLVLSGLLFARRRRELAHPHVVEHPLARSLTGQRIVRFRRPSRNGR